jgi:uncharacterized RDD family membrane protein YckC
MTTPTSDSIVTPEAVSVTMDVAGLGSRMISALIDSAIQLALIVASFMIFGPAFGALGISDTAGMVSFFVVLFLVTWAYYPLFEGLMHGATPGKRAQRLRVMSADGQPARIGAILLRNVLRIVDFLPFYYMIGIVTMLGTKRSQRLGDLVARTVVVRERRAIPPASASPFVASAAAAASRVDAGGLTEREYDLVRAFLQRRATLDPGARVDLARKLAQTFRARVGGSESLADDELFLEALAAGYRHRFRDDAGAPRPPTPDAGAPRPPTPGGELPPPL